MLSPKEGVSVVTGVEVVSTLELDCDEFRMAVGHSVTDELCGWLEEEDTLGLREGVTLEVCPKTTGINA